MKIPRNAMRQTIKLFACGFSLVPSPYAPYLSVLCQLRQRHVTYRIDAVDVLVLGLIRHVPISILVPLIRSQVTDDTCGVSSNVHTITLEDIQP